MVDANTTISQYQLAIGNRSSAIAQAQKEAEGFEPQIERSQQMLRSASPGQPNLPTQQARLRLVEGMRADAKSEALKNVAEAMTSQKQIEQQFSEYLKSPGGIIQSAKEGKGTITTEMQSYGMGGQNYSILPVVTYTSPAGTYKDESAYYEAMKQESKGTAATAAGQSFANLPAYYQYNPAEALSAKDIASIKVGDYANVPVWARPKDWKPEVPSGTTTSNAVIDNFILSTTRPLSQIPTTTTSLPTQRIYDYGGRDSMVVNTYASPSNPTGIPVGTNPMTQNLLYNPPPVKKPTQSIIEVGTPVGFPGGGNIINLAGRTPLVGITDNASRNYSLIPQGVTEVGFPAKSVTSEISLTGITDVIQSFQPTYTPSPYVAPVPYSWKDNAAAAAVKEVFSVPGKVIGGIGIVGDWVEGKVTKVMPGARLATNRIENALINKDTASKAISQNPAVISSIENIAVPKIAKYGIELGIGGALIAGTGYLAATALTGLIGAAPAAAVGYGVDIGFMASSAASIIPMQVTKNAVKEELKNFNPGDLPPEMREVWSNLTQDQKIYYVSQQLEAQKLLKGEIKSLTDAQFIAAATAALAAYAPTRFLSGEIRTSEYAGLTVNQLKELQTLENAGNYNDRYWKLKQKGSSAVQTNEAKFNAFQDKFKGGLTKQPTDIVSYQTGISRETALDISKAGEIPVWQSTIDRYGQAGNRGLYEAMVGADVQGQNLVTIGKKLGIDMSINSGIHEPEFGLIKLGIGESKGGGTEFAGTKYTATAQFLGSLPGAEEKSFLFNPTTKTSAQWIEEQNIKERAVDFVRPSKLKLVTQTTGDIEAQQFRQTKEEVVNLPKLKYSPDLRQGVKYKTFTIEGSIKQEGKNTGLGLTFEESPITGKLINQKAYITKAGAKTAEGETVSNIFMFEPGKASTQRIKVSSSETIFGTIPNPKIVISKSAPEARLVGFQQAVSGKMDIATFNSPLGGKLVTREYTTTYYEPIQPTASAKSLAQIRELLYTKKSIPLLPGIKLNAEQTLDILAFGKPEKAIGIKGAIGAKGIGLKVRAGTEVPYKRASYSVVIKNVKESGGEGLVIKGDGGGRSLIGRPGNIKSQRRINILDLSKQEVKMAEQIDGDLSVQAKDFSKQDLKMVRQSPLDISPRMSPKNLIIKESKTLQSFVPAKSAYEGLGMYERTGETAMTIGMATPSATMLTIQTMQPQMQILRIQQPQILQMQLKTEQTLREEMNPVLDVTPKLDSKLILDMGEVLQQRIGQEQVPALSLNLQQQQLQIQQVEQVQTRPSIETMRRPQPQPQPEIKTKPKEELFVLGSEEMKKKRLPGKKVLTSSFLPQVRRRGKFLPVARPTPSLETAGLLAVTSARRTLGVSARVLDVATGREVKFKAPADFAQSKKNPFVMIQRRGTRLGSRTERLEIISSRRNRRIKFI